MYVFEDKYISRGQVSLVQTIAPGEGRRPAGGDLREGRGRGVEPSGGAEGKTGPSKVKAMDS